MSGHPEKALKRPKSAWRTLAGNIEGYLAFAATLLVFHVPVTPGTREEATYTASILHGLGIGLGIGGVRFGEGIGRIAAWMALAFLVPLFVVLVALALADWEQVCSYWQRQL